MIKSFKFKLKPTKNQVLELNQWLGTCRFVYNLCLGHKKDLYSNYGINISKNELQKELSLIRKDYDWIGKVHSQTIQDVTDRLDKSYKFFFKGNGFPKFAKRNLYSSFAFKQGVGFCENTNKLKLPSLGKISFKKSMEIPYVIKYAIIKKEYDGWYISLACEVKTEFLPQNENVIGIDLGIKDYIITSNGDKINNPKFLRESEPKLKKIQQSLAKKAKGGQNKKKLLYELQKVHAKVKNKRNDFLHKLSTKIINENQVIIVEDLNISGMSKRCKSKKEDKKFIPNGQSAKSGLNKSIMDAGWGMFLEMLEYKSKFRGRTFIKVSPHNTSKNCSCCGKANESLILEIRKWVCTSCGTVHDRDINASFNIMNKGLNLLKEAGHAFSTSGDMEPVSVLA